MDTKRGPEEPAPRTTAEIFGDLRALAQSDGALHEISSIIYRDWVLTVDVQEGRVIDEPERRWSPSKLNKNELMLLLGLMVQSTSNRTYAVETRDDTFPTRADRLLREFHDRVLADGALTFDRETGKFIERPDSIGLMGREAIYYGADSFYLHQLQRYSRLRYRDDATWLLQNAGLSIRPMIDIARFIIDRINAQMTSIGHLRRRGSKFTSGDLTNSLLIAKADVRKKFGGKAEAFFLRFLTPVNGANPSFTHPFAINAVAIAPIIDLGDYLYVPCQYRLFETIYESPFYWMMADKAYANTEAEHRGAFLEGTAAHILCSVFGVDNVYENVTLKENAREIAGEIDVLVIYGEFVIVVQAKSKRVTLKARAGDTEALKTDFEGAIQAPYRQALKCINLIKAGARCEAPDGTELTFHSLPRFFPMVVLSDSFPASTFLSGEMLERGDNIAPVIWDIGVLDCVARLLPTAIEMIFYLKCRSDVFDKVLSDSEYNSLGYHIGFKLGLPPDLDGMVLDRDFASVVDDYMIAADVGIKAERPVGVLERLQIPVVSELLAELKSADQRIASVVIDLYNFSSAALTDISANILNLREEISKTGKAIKAFSIPTASGGLTYAVTRRKNTDSARAAQAIGTKHKYDTKSDRWYVILDSIETENPIDGLLPLVWPWEEDVDEAKYSEQVARIFNSRREAVTIGDAARKRTDKH
jgi:Nuclease-related domain